MTASLLVVTIDGVTPTVLIADDDGTSRMLLRRLLEQDGYAVRAAENGVEALELFAAEDIDIVLLDIVMPGLDGISAAEGLTTPHQLVAEIGSIIMQRARRTIVVADSSKIGRRGFTGIAPLSAVHTLVTDEGADPAELGALSALGVDVHVV